MALLSENIGFFLVGLYVLTAVACCLVNTAQTFAKAALLGLMTMAAWIPSLWLSPSDMSVAHLAIFTAMVVSLDGPGSKRMLVLSFGMILSDVYWSFSASTSLYLWQASLNTVFFLLCASTLHFCYNARTTSGRKHDEGYGRFYARVQVDNGSAEAHRGV